MVSIEDILLLLGNRLSDVADDVKGRLRAFIEQDKWTPEDYIVWIQECVNKGGRTDRSYYSVLQDLIVSVGRRLGFEIEYGRYTGHTQEIAYDGLWKSSSGNVILLEVKTSAWPIESVGQLGDYLRRYAEVKSIPLHGVFGLYVIGGGELQPIVDQIRGSEFRSVLRAISFDDLLKLWQLKNDLESIGGPGSADAKVQTILLPIDSINIGSLLEIITSIAELRQATGEIIQQEAVEMISEELPWEQSTLLRYLAETTPFQKALLASLALSEIEPVPLNVLTRQMSLVAQTIPEIQQREITGYTIGGARAGLKMRRGDKEDIIAQDEAGRYYIKSAYKTLIADWVRSQGLTIPAETSIKEE